MCDVATKSLLGEMETDVAGLGNRTASISSPAHKYFNQ